MNTDTNLHSLVLSWPTLNIQLILSHTSLEFVKKVHTIESICVEEKFNFNGSNTKTKKIMIIRKNTVKLTPIMLYIPNIYRRVRRIL